MPASVLANSAVGCKPPGCICSTHGHNLILWSMLVLALRYIFTVQVRARLPCRRLPGRHRRSVVRRATLIRYSLVWQQRDRQTTAGLRPCNATHTCHGHGMEMIEKKRKGAGLGARGVRLVVWVVCGNHADDVACILVPDVNMQCGV
jgi:hypothetical protein